MPNKVLETKNLNAYYGDFQALFEVSIDPVSYTHLRAHET